MPQIDFGKPAIELPKPNIGSVDVFVTGTTDRVENTDSRQERNGLARGGEELFDGFLVIAGLAEHLAVEHGDLVCANDECIPGVNRDRLGFLSRQVRGQRLRLEAHRVAFVDIRRNGFVLVQEPVQQAAPVARRRRKNDRRCRRILHKIKNLGRKPCSLPSLCASADFFATGDFDSCIRGPYHARAMGNPLRDRRTPAELAVSSQVIEIDEKIGNLGRLAKIVEADLGSLAPAIRPTAWRDSRVTGELRFGFADAQESLPAVDGHIAVTLDAVCQRCLEVCRVPLQAKLRWLFGDADQAAGVGYEAWELDEERLQPIELVEETLVLALPFAPVHDDAGDCAGAVATEAATPGTVRPFADLKDRMKNDN